MSAEIPIPYLPLIIDPNFGMLGTICPDHTVQVNPMWFEYQADSDTVEFTHTTYRKKFRNLQRNPSMSLAIFDPQDPERYLEVRGAISRRATRSSASSR